MATKFDCWRKNTKRGKRHAVKADYRLLLSAYCLLLTAFFPATAPAQIKTDIIEKYRADLQKQGVDPEMKRERGTQPQDWLFALPDGVKSRQITFYSDGTPCYGRIFFPKGFNARGKWPAVVVGHGINAQAVGIELSLVQQLGLLGILLVTSKGGAGVAGSAIVVLVSTLAATGTVPVAAVGIILGVHRLMSSAFVAVNILGNSLATIVIAGWEGAVDRRALQDGLEAGPA